jgi:predicted histidine transporter YuiF (NhaC family)
MINIITNLGITGPIIGIVLLYGMGTIYYTSLYRALGFSGYTGSVDINQILLINLNSIVLLGSIAGNLLGIMYLFRREKDAENVLLENDEEKAKIKRKEFIQKHRRGCAERWLSYTLFFMYCSLTIYHFIWGNSLNGINMILGLAIACLIYLAISAKAYDNKWALSAVACALVLAHASYVGFVDAVKIKRESKNVTMIIDSNKQVGNYLSQDTEYIYAMIDDVPVSIRKEFLSSITWK